MPGLILFWQSQLLTATALLRHRDSGLVLESGLARISFTLLLLSFFLWRRVTLALQHREAIVGRRPDIQKD